MKKRGKNRKRRYRCIYGVPWISLCRGQYDKCSGDIQGGALDNWDAKLKNIHEKYIKEEKRGLIM